MPIGRPEPGPVPNVAEVPPAENDGAPPPHRRRFLLILGAIALAILLMALGVIIGVALRRSALTDARDRASAAQRETRSVQAGAQAQARRIAALRAQLRARDATIAGLNRRIALLEQQTPASPQTPQTPPPSQATTTTTLPATLSAGSFGDGLYAVGADVQAGQYRTRGGAACYWAKLTSSDTNNVLVNNLTAGPQTVAIDSPYFVSDGCGTWTKVG
jgi:hypothetical protein